MKRALIILLFILHSSSLILKGRRPAPKIEAKPAPSPIVKTKKKKKKIVKSTPVIPAPVEIQEKAPQVPTKEVEKPKKEVEKDIPKYVYYSAELESLGSLALNAGHYKKQYDIMFRLGLKFRAPEMSLNMEFSSAYEFDKIGVGIIYEESVFKFKRDPLVTHELGAIIETTGRHERYFLKGNKNYISTGYRWDF